MSVQIVYFPARGRAEISRLVLEIAGAEYENVNLDYEKLGALKQTGELAYGQVPLLRDGDFSLVQSIAIARYLARKHDLYGADIKEGAQIDSIIDGANDVTNKLIPLIFPKPDLQGLADLKATGFPKFIANFENILSKNNNGDGWFVGNAISLADIAIFLLLEGADSLSFDLQPYPKLAAFRSRFESHEKVAAYISSDRRYPARQAFELPEPSNNDN
eukprot:TRINITY_DN351_c0_g1_i3.p1 TRINITY_DN351_c0_g1~~TRINITY_DN351_c0_g1_i3.p1  ORF type:complete len:217 (-),score=89.16 TRINITY_DN351_c0_g1_i3:190-840(-)